MYLSCRLCSHDVHQVRPFRAARTIYNIYKNRVLYDIMCFDELKLKGGNMSQPTDRIDLQQMRESATRACALMKTLGNADRLLLLCQLTQGEFCVSELEVMLDIQQPTLSQQLGVLREESMVSTRRDGKQIYYSMASKEAASVMQVLYQLFCESGGANDN